MKQPTASMFCFVMLLLFCQLASAAPDTYKLEDFRKKMLARSRDGDTSMTLTVFTIGAVTVNLESNRIQGDDRITVSRRDFRWDLEDIQRFVRFYFDYTSLSNRERRQHSAQGRQVVLIRNALSFITFIARLNRESTDRSNRHLRIQTSHDFFQQLFAQRNGVPPYQGFFDPGNAQTAARNGESDANNGVILFILAMVSPFELRNISPAARRNNRAAASIATLHQRFDLLQEAFTLKSYNRNFQNPRHSRPLSEHSPQLDLFELQRPDGLADIFGRANLSNELILLIFMRALAVASLNYQLSPSAEECRILEDYQSILATYLTDDILVVAARSLLVADLGARGLHIPPESREFNLEQSENLASQADQLYYDSGQRNLPGRAFFGSLPLVLDHILNRGYNFVARFINHALESPHREANPLIPLRSAAHGMLQQEERGQNTAAASDPENDEDEAESESLRKRNAQLTLQLNMFIEQQQGASTSEPQPQGAVANNPQAETTGNLCVICLEQERNQVFVPCGHVCACRQCAQALFNQPDKKCPLCRGRIEQLIRVFFN